MLNQKPIQVPLVHLEVCRLIPLDFQSIGIAKLLFTVFGNFYNILSSCFFSAGMDNAIH